MGISLSNNLNINWVEEQRESDPYAKLYADVEPNTSVNQILIELNTAPIDQESKFTRDAIKNGYNPNQLGSPAWTTKEIVLNFKNPISERRRDDIVQASIWSFKDQKKTSHGFNQLIFDAVIKNNKSLERQVA